MVIETAMSVAFLYITIVSMNSFGSAIWGVVFGLNISSWIAVYFNYKKEQEWKREVVSVIKMIEEQQEKDDENK